MPDGARIVRVSTECLPTAILGHGEPLPLPDPQGVLPTTPRGVRGVVSDGAPP